MAEPMIKGAVLREFVQWYETNYGMEGLRSVAGNLPEDLRRYIDPFDPLVNLLASSWYPSRFCNLLLDAVGEGRTHAELEHLAHDATRWIVARGMNSVYRFALRRLITPEMYALSVPRLWRQLHTTGDREVQVTSRTTLESKVKSWPGHHPILCTVTIETMCAILETMKCRDVKWRRVSCVSRGASECVTHVEWK
jgi:hypothetical protein